MIWHCLVLNRNDALFYGTKSKKFVRNFPNKYRKQLLDIGLAALKTTFKKVVTNSVTNLYNDKFVKTKPAEEVIILPGEREEI